MTWPRVARWARSNAVVVAPGYSAVCERVRTIYASGSGAKKSRPVA